MANKNYNIGYMICETDTSGLPEAKIVAEKNDKPIAEVVLQRTGVKNRNGRFYAPEELDPQLTCPRSIELISTGNMKGENGHPLSKELIRQQTIDPEHVCFKMIKWWKDGDLVKAHVTGTNNDAGRDFNNDLLDGEKPSFSLRALGTVQNTNRGAEVRNIKLITYDRVYYPSHPEAYTDRLISESVQGVQFTENKDTGIFTPISNDQVINYIKSESCNLKSIKESFDVFYDDITILENGKVQLSDKQGHMFIVNLETYIQNEIMDYCNKFFI